MQPGLQELFPGLQRLYKKQKNSHVWQKKIKVNNVITFENYMQVQYLQLYNVEQMKNI